MTKPITPTRISLSTLRNLSVFVLLIFWLLQFGQSTAIRATSAIDLWLLRLGVEFRALPVQTAPLTIVHVPDLEYDKWLIDLAGAQGLIELFEKGGLYNGTGKGSTAIYGLVMAYPFSMVRSTAENLLAEIQQSQATLESIYPDLKKLLVRRAQLVDILNGPQTIVGMENALPLDWPVVTVHGRQGSQQSGWLTDYLWPELPGAEGEHLSLGPVKQALPILPSDLLAPALLARQGDTVHPGFSLGFMQAAIAKRDATPRGGTRMEWTSGTGVDLGGRHAIATDAAGRIVPLYGSATGVQAAVRQITLHAALALDELSGWVLIGRDGSPLLNQVAQQLAALADGAYLHEPLWWSPYSKAVLLGMTLILLVVATFSRLLYTGYVWLACVLAASMVNLGGQIYTNYWLPVAWILLYLVVLLAVLFVWRWQRTGFLKLYQQLDSVSLDYAGDLIQEERTEHAFRVLRHCRTSGELLQKLYTLAEARIEKSHPLEAMSILREISSRRRRYRDVEAKIAALRPVVQKIVEEQAVAETSGVSPETSLADAEEQGVLARTQVLPVAAPRLRRTLGRYEIQEEIGRGAFGTVYRAFDPHIARQVAIKTLNYVTAGAENRTELKERFFREAQAAGRLSHPHIVHVYDVGEQDQLAYIAMDYARGQPLSAYILPDKLLPVVDVYRIIMNVAEALAFAHSHNVIHRDIKPGNIILNQQPYQLKVTDFGIARITDFAQTSTGEILGSPLYMAPEQLTGKRAGPQADIFSLGVMFYQLVSGQLPFHGENLASLSYEVIHAKHKSVRAVRKELPSSATRIINRALQKKPGDRYESAADMAEALRRALSKDFNGALKESSRSRMGDLA